jgi:hypothetical protein
MKQVICATLAMLPIVFACSSASNDTPVTSADVAILSARHAWQSVYEKSRSPVYSKESAAKFEPYTATLENGVWHVRGNIPAGYQGEVLETTVLKVTAACRSPLCK